MDMMLAALSWDPGFRGLLTVAVGVLVLMGSVYLLLATNTGPRLGFLIALTGLAGWMFLMGFVWSMYGIGYLGRTATWNVEEINYADLTQAGNVEARNLPEPEDLPDTATFIAKSENLQQQFPDDPTRKQPTLGDLLGVDPSLAEDPSITDKVPEGWSLLASSDAQTGEAVASASAFVVDERKLFEAQTDFTVLNSYSYGGKDRRAPDANLLERIGFKLKRILTWPFGHPKHDVVVQLQRVIPREQAPGEPPPVPEADPGEPTISVVMTRDLGSRRLPSVFLTISSAIVFAICCNSLHRRDKLVARARAAAGT